MKWGTALLGGREGICRQREGTESGVRVKVTQKLLRLEITTVYRFTGEIDFLRRGNIWRGAISRGCLEEAAWVLAGPELSLY